MRVNRSNEAVPPLAPPAAPQPRSSDPPPADDAKASGFAKVLRGLGSELDRGEALTARAIRGGAPGSCLSPEALLALQAGVYRYSEAVDVVTKLVDRATQAVKTTVQNQ